MSINISENLQLKLNRMYLFVIVGTIVFGFVFWNLLNNRQGHYYDQGYRLCMNYITGENSSDRKLVATCLEKYLELKEKILQENY